MAAVQDAAVEIAAKYDRAYWLNCVEQKSHPAELISALGDSGLLGIGVPEEYGGQGGGVSELSVLIEAMSRAGLPLPTVLTANFARNLVIRHGTAEQIRSFVEPTLTGSVSTCFALTEADAGTNAFAMRTRAEKCDGGWKISGQKVFISGAAEAGQMMLVARTSAHSPDNRTSGLSLFVFDLPQAGISMDPMNVKASEPDVQYIVHFDDAFLPHDALVGEQDNGAAYLFDALNPERVLSGMMIIGLGMHVLSKGVQYAKVRDPFGTPIGAYQAVQHPLARAYVGLESARMMVYEAAAIIDSGDPAGSVSNAAKLLASEASNAALDATIQTHGGAAFDREYDVVTFFEQIRLSRIAPVNNEMVLSYIASHVLGLPRGY